MRLRWPVKISDSKIAVFDVETTGTDPESDRVVEVGAAFYDNGVWTRRRSLVNPGVPIPAGATAVHGLSDEKVSGAESLKDLWPRFVSQVSGRLLCGYNVLSYDLPLLAAEAKRHDFDLGLDRSAVLDVIVFARWHLRHLPGSLSDIAAGYGISPEGGKAHSAAVDCQMTGRLLMAMVSAGLIPQNVEDALSEQARLLPVVEEERAKWGNFVYRHRVSGKLMIGAGKHRGTPISDVPRSYLSFIAGKFQDLPEATLSLFRDISSGKSGAEVQEPVPGAVQPKLVSAVDMRNDGDVRR